MSRLAFIALLLEIGCAQRVAAMTDAQVAREPTLDVPPMSDTGAPTDLGSDLPSSPALARRLQASGMQTCLLDAAHGTRCWGRTLTSDGTVARASPPFVATAMEGAELAVGGGYVCLRAREGGVSCMGTDRYGTLGRGSSGAPSAPLGAVVGLPPAAQLSAGETHACVLAADATVWCWGRAADGQIDTQFSDRVVATPVRVEGIPPMSEVRTGTDFTCALSRLGEVYCWGANNVSQCGLPRVPGFIAPTRVPDLPAVARLAAGVSSACAVLVHGGVRCWGQINAAPFGDRPLERLHEKVDVGVPNDASEVAVTHDRLCYRSGPGSFACRGARDHGQLGDGVRSTMPEARFVPMFDWRDVEQLTLGVGFSCALRDGGTVWCWGDRSAGLVDGVPAEFQVALVPVRVL